MDMLQRKSKPLNERISFNYYYELSKKMYKTQVHKWVKKWTNPDNQKMVWLTGFLMISTYLCYKIQSKFDVMKRRTTNTKTFKQAQIERQNLEIVKFLNKN